MAAVPSTMLALGTPAPDFDLPDVVSGRKITLASGAGPRGLLVMFISRHCPYVQHVKHELAKLGRDYEGKGVGIVAICSNDIVNYPADAPSGLNALAEEMGFVFPVCYDESQATAQAFTAACTPDFFLFDGRRKLVYRGQLDDSRPGNGKPVTGRDIRAALDATLSGKAISPDQRPSLGCNIKWKAGNEPPYYK
jgi:thiol-disulfide isomerase/thioredoxin